MKAIPFQIPKEDTKSIKVQIDQGPYFYDKLHYHREVQITLIVKGTGIVYGGNNMHKFGPGDIIMFGANIPHLLKNGSNYFSDDSPGVLSHTLFFDKDSFGGGLFQINEMNSISAFIDTSARGIILSDDEISKDVLQAKDQKNEDLVISLLSILRKISRTEYTFINSELYNLSLDENVGNRLNDILTYTFKHLDQKIHIEEVAKKANLSRSQFSRYFKKHIGKSYVQFLNELRIENACASLIDSEKNIETICYQVGFQNVSNFNRIFKKVKGVSPRAYRKISNQK